MFYKIKTVDIIYETKESIEEILIELDKYQDKIVELDLSNNTYKPHIFQFICDRIKNMSNLKKIICSSIMSCLSYEETCEIGIMLNLALIQDIEELDLSNNALSCRFSISIEELIKKNKLKKLIVYNCGLAREGIERILKALENNNQLQILDIGKNRINTLSKELGIVLNKFINLKELKLAHNTIYEGMNEFLCELKDIQLEILDISDNFIEEPYNFCKLLQNSHLIELYIRDIKNDYMKTILLTINSLSPQLKILDISQNDMESEDELDLIISIVKNHYMLVKLIMYDNFWSQDEDFSDKINKLENIAKMNNIECVLNDPNISNDEDFKIQSISERLKNI